MNENPSEKEPRRVDEAQQHPGPAAHPHASVVAFPIKTDRTLLRQSFRPICTRYSFSYSRLQQPSTFSLVMAIALSVLGRAKDQSPAALLSLFLCVHALTRLIGDGHRKGQRRRTEKRERYEGRPCETDRRDMSRSSQG